MAALSIGLGTLFAIWQVPEDPRPEGALFVPSLAMTLGLLLPPLARARGGVREALRVENLLSVALVYWLMLDLLQAAYQIWLSREVVQLAFAAIGLMGAGVFLGAAGRSWRIPAMIAAELRYRWSASSLLVAAVACFLLGMLAFAIPTDFDLGLMASALGMPRWLTPWGRGQLGGLDAFWNHLQYFGYLLPTLTVALAKEKGWIHPAVAIVGLLAVCMMLFLSQSGGRRVIGVALGAAILCWALGHRTIRARLLVGVGAASAAVLYLMQQILRYRSLGWFEEADRRYDHLHVDDNFLRLAQVIEAVPADHAFVYLNQIVYVLVRPIPRLLWPDKPVDPGFSLPALLDIQGTSLSYSIVGEWYLVWGFPAVFVGGWFLGRLASWVNTMVLAQRPNVAPVFVAICMMVLFSGVRSMQDLVIMSYAALAWLAVSGALRALETRRRTSVRFDV